MQTRHQSRKSSYTDSNSVPSSPYARNSLLKEKSNPKQNQIMDQNQKYKKYDAHISDDTSEGTEDESEFVHMSDISDSEKPKPSANSSGNKSPPKEQHKKTIDSRTSNTYIFVLGVLLLGLVIAVKWGFHFDSHGHRKIETLSPAVDTLDKTFQLIEEMQNSFPGQSNATWISFLAALTNIMEEEPSQPEILLLVGQENTVHTMQCVAEQLAVTTNKRFSAENYAVDLSAKVIVQVSDLVRLQKQEDAMKKELDTRIRSILNQSYSVVLGPLEDIPPQAALILHAYCDNFTAPFKKSIIILTATFGSDRPADSKQVDRKLHRLWDAKLGVDKSASLVSRVANNVVFIEPEPMPCANGL